MSLQIELKSVKAVPQGSGTNLTCNLTAWPEGVVKQYPVVDDDGNVTDINNAVMFRNHTVYVKGHVQGMTVEELVEREMPRFKEYWQKEIDEYLRVDEVLQTTALTDGLVTIGSELVTEAAKE